MGRRSPGWMVGGGILAILVVLAISARAYWHYANLVPVYPPPNVVMPAPNAYEDYVRAGRMCQAAGGSSVRPVSPNGVARDGYQDGVPLEQVRAAVARNRAALARLRQGFRKQFRNPPPTSSSQMFPELGDFRELARVLVTEGRLAEREGRLADAVRSYLDCLHLGVDVPRGGTLIHGLTGLAIQQMGLGALAKVAHRIDGPAALAAAREMARLDRGAPTAADAFQWEKDATTAMVVDTLRKGVSWREFVGLQGTPTPREAAFALWFGLTPKQRMLDNYRAYMDAVTADARKPLSVPSTLPPAPNDPLNQILLPVFTTVKRRWAERAAGLRRLELRLAARAYEAAHGAPPDSAAALVPRSLPEVPLDPFTGKPMKL